MKVRSRIFPKAFGLFFTGLVLGIGSQGLHSQGFPVKPIKVVVPASPATAPDTMSRTVTQELSLRLGQPILIENVPGAGGNIATVNVARAAPNGYTLLMQLSSFVVNPSLYKNPGYDPIKQFDPVIQSAWTVTLLGISMRGTEGVNSVSDLIAFAKARPGQLNYTSSGVGTPQHLRMEILIHLTGADFTHVPFKSPAEMTRAMLVGDVTAMFNSATVLIPQARAGKIKLLAYVGKERWPQVPEVPTMAEAGFPEFKADIWHGFLAPAGTPKDIIRKLNTEFTAVLTAPATQQALIKLGISPTTSTPEEFGEIIKTDLAYWTKMIKEIGIAAE